MTSFLLLTLVIGISRGTADPEIKICGHPGISTTGSYVILTNYNEESPYYPAIQKLAEYRQARILHFDTDVFVVLDSLKVIQPAYVAVMIPPETLDENFAYDVFSLAKQVDEAFDTDFAYGFIAGNHADEVMQYVERIIAYEQQQIFLNKVFRCFWRTGAGALSGGIGSSGDMNTAAEVDAFKALGYDSRRVNLDSTGGPQVTTHILSSGILHLFLHGSQSMVEHIASSDIPQLINPLIIINNGCYGGCTHKWYNQGISGNFNSYEELAIYSDPEISFALNFMKKGALAYFGHLCMWGSDWQHNLIDWCLGAPDSSIGNLVKRIYNVPVSPYHISAADTVGAFPNYLFGIDQNQWYYAAYILFGDPAIKILTPKFMLAASFSADIRSGSTPLAVQFSDQSSGTIENWSWDFGDGTTSREQNPLHWYNSTGKFTVALTVTGPGGIDTKTLNDYIVATQTAAVEGEPDMQIAEFRLDGAYPNPFNQTICIAFSVPKPLRLTISIYNFSGQLVQSLIDGQAQQGDQKIFWHAGRQPSGIYLICLRAGNVQRTQKCLLLK